MKKLRNLIALCAVFSMAAVFTGCGDDDDGDDDNQPPAGPQFAPLTLESFRANTYSITVNGQPAQLTFPSATTYALTSGGVTETGTITGLARNGEDYIATLQPQNNDGTVRAGEMRAHFTQKTATTFAGTLTVQTASGAQTFPFNASVNTGGTTGDTTSGTTGDTTSGTTGDTTSGTTGDTTSGTTGDTTSGTTGDTTSGTTGDPGVPPDALTGLRLQLTYGGFGELFTFTSATAGLYEQGQDTITYTWDRADTRLMVTRRSSAGTIVGLYNIDLTFNQGSGRTGTATVVFKEREDSTEQTDPATFTLQ